MSIPPIEEALLEQAKVEKLAERPRLEPMPHKGRPIADDPSALKDPSRQRRGSGIEKDQINFVRPKVCSHSRQETRQLLNRIPRVLKVHGHVHVAQRCEPADAGPTEQVRKKDAGTPIKNHPERRKTVFDVSRERLVTDHVGR
jgi:hypothetical protein